LARTASLEIHQINVGQGDSILVVNRDAVALKTLCVANGFDAAKDAIDCLPFAQAAVTAGGVAGKAIATGLPATVKAAVLIDGGDALYGADVVAYLTWVGVLQPAVSAAAKLTVVTTHYHADHYGGLRDLFAQKKEVLRPKTVTKGKKRSAATEKVVTIELRHAPATVYHATRNAKADGDGPLLLSYNKYTADYAAQVLDVSPGGRHNGTSCIVALGNAGAANLPVTLTAIASSQSVSPGDGKGLVAIKSVGSKPDQNDRSIVFVLEYGSFRYFLGGDIAGAGSVYGGNGAFSMPDGTGTGPKAARKFTSHANVETQVGIALETRYPSTKNAANAAKVTAKGHCCVFKADHHASMSSVDVYLLSTMTPRVGVITSGVRESFHSHPTAEVLGRLSAPNWNVRPSNPATTLPTAQIANTLSASVVSASQTANQLGGVYVNEVAKTYGGKAFLTDAAFTGVKIIGDQIVRPVDEQVAAIQAAATAGTATLDIQVYGSGVQTELDPTGDTSLRPIDTTKAAPYPVGPFWHSCNRH
jgi:beta-lactamase superfamily II metal-dependent hydrolase